MATYFGTSINPSPTVVFPASDALGNVQGLALSISEGKLKLPTKGDNVIGIALFTEDDAVAAGDDVTVQVKDIGKWIAGEKIDAGDELTANEKGQAVKAGDGNFITAVALNSAAKEGTVLTVQIIKAGYKGGAGGSSSATTKLSELSDVELSSEADGHVLTYGSDGKWKNKAPEAVKKNLADLEDVQISGSADKDTLEYSSSESKWKNKAVEAV